MADVTQFIDKPKNQSDFVDQKYPNLDIGIAQEIRLMLHDNVGELFLDSEKINDAYKEASNIPSSPEDVNSILIKLQYCADPEIVRTKLAQVIIYMRSEKDLRSCKTSEGDVVVAEIEPNLINFLNSYSGRFYDIYPWIRELVGIIPKTEIFGIDIVELREDIADFHEDRKPDDPFMNSAGEIREAIHRRLSVEAVEYIDEYVAFLYSDKRSDFVAGVPCMTHEGDKEKELSSDSFKILQRVKGQLQLIWNNPFSRKDTVTSSTIADETDTREFLLNAVKLIRKLSDPYIETIQLFDNGTNFVHHLERNLDAMKGSEFASMNLGILRIYLRNVIIDAMGQNGSRDGKMIFNLMTLDTVLENLSLIYYADIVNVELSEINDENYERAIDVLVQLVSCTRATGQGTKSLGRFGLYIAQLASEEKLESKSERVHSGIDEMYIELLNYLYNLRQKIKNLLNAANPDPSDYEKIYMEHLNTKLLNDVVREKTTHLLGNLLDGIRRFIGGGDKEIAAQIAKGQRRSGKLDLESQPIAKSLFAFGPDIDDPKHSAKRAWLMGGKGASLAEMSNMIVSENLQGVDVPKGFGLSTSTWPRVKNNHIERAELTSAILDQLANLESRTGKKFGDPSDPLILAARSGAIVSMPGTLATIAHIGLNDEIVDSWSKSLAYPHFAYHAYLRFLFNYSENVLNISPDVILRSFGFVHVADLCTEDIDELKRNIRDVKVIISDLSDGMVVPDNCYDQLYDSIKAVFQSYESKEAQHQVRLKHIPPKYQTACLVQECLSVLSDRDCSGVFFTRDPRDGGRGRIEFIHEFGEDLVGGRAKPKFRDDFERMYPNQYRFLSKVGDVAEKRYWHPNDIEFAIRGEKLYILQTRRLLLTPMANVVTNYQLYERGIINDDELVRRTKRIVNQPLLNTYLDEEDKRDSPPVADGEPVSGGVVSGRLISDQLNIEDFPGDDIIFIVKSNLPNQIENQSRIKGYISEEGGATSHAALKSIGEFSCVVGIDWSKEGDKIIIGDTILKEGDFVTVDANEGYIYAGRLPINEFQEDNPEFIEAKKIILDIIESMD